MTAYTKQIYKSKQHGPPRNDYFGANLVKKQDNCIVFAGKVIMNIIITTYILHKKIDIWLNLGNELAYTKFYRLY